MSPGTHSGGPHERADTAPARPAIPLRRWRIAAAAVIAVGTALRAGAARGDLWLDEIWSLYLARDARSMAGVFTGLHHDNNHHLITLWLLFAGPAASSFTYRLPAVLAGVATLALIALRPVRLPRLEGLIWLSFAALSRMLVQYQSEARGYGLAILLAVAAFAALERYLATGRRRWAAAFAGAAGLGLLAHLTFVYVALAFVAWGVTALALDADSRRRACTVLTAVAVPAAAFALLWFVDLRHLEVGGGPATPLTEALRALSRATFGLQPGPLELVGLLALVGAADELRRMAAARRPEAAFHATALVLAPAGLLAWRRPEHLAPRYFVVAVPFFLLLVARSAARWLRRGGWARLGVLLLLALLGAGSSVQLARLLRDGRGQYRAAVAYILSNSPGVAPTIASDHDFRNPMLLDHYGRELSRGSGLSYVTNERCRSAAPQWYLRHDVSDPPHFTAEIAGPRGLRYRLVREYPTGGLSGWHWAVYRRVDPAAAAP